MSDNSDRAHKNLDDDITLYMKEELGDDFISIQERIHLCIHQMK